MTIRQFISEIDAKYGPKPIHVGVSDLAFSDGKHELKTTLGSCVAVILFTKKKGEDCSMSHYLLPAGNGDRPTTDRDRHKYGDLIIPEQIQKMYNIFGNSAKLYAKITGGSKLLNDTQNPIISKIGAKNIEIAKTLLRANNIEIISEHVGGQTARAVRFFPETNSLWIYEFQSKKEFLI
ncbi:MAG: chemotaxis protein CheD [Leptospirales bacterium]